MSRSKPRLLILLTLFAVGMIASSTIRAQTPSDQLSPEAVERFVDLALKCVHKEYPNKISHVMKGALDAGHTPSELTPVFYGCFDWHSSVHGHWLLVRACRMFPKAKFAHAARAALNRSFTDQRVAGEVAYINVKHRITFERPYGLAWLLQLCAELRQWKSDEDAQRWLKSLEPLETLAVKRFRDWLPKLSHPIRTGEHSQTAFALGLVYDWATTAQDRALVKLIVAKGKHWYLADRGWRFQFEPSGQDFLSPGLAEADFMRRLLSPPQFAAWLGAFLPGFALSLDASAAESSELPLMPTVVTDKSDGKLAHLDGLNLSRAWMLEGIHAGLPSDDPRRLALTQMAKLHRESGLMAVGSEHYAGGHWLGSFALYLVTQRGLNR